MRLRKVKNALERLHASPVFLSGYKEDSFQEKQPLCLEIGTGKGMFLIEMAKANPDVNFIGLEVAESVLVRAVEKKEAEVLSNLRFILGDAGELANMFPEKIFDVVHLNFSDPWPKIRHEKRRLTYKTFLVQYQRILKENGKISMKTDNRHLFEYTLKSMNSYGMDLIDVSLDLHDDERNDQIETEYEKKFKDKGAIYFLEAKFK